MTDADDSIILDEVHDENYEPTDLEVHEYAVWLGMDPEADSDMLWIAREGMKAPLPDAWKPCQTSDGEIYYFNFDTQESIWEHPCDEYYRKLYQEHLAKKKDRRQQRPRSEGSSRSDGKKSKKRKSGTRSASNRTGTTSSSASGTPSLRPVTADAALPSGSSLAPLKPLRGPKSVSAAGDGAAALAPLTAAAVALPDLSVMPRGSTSKAALPFALQELEPLAKASTAPADKYDFDENDDVKDDDASDGDNKTAAMLKQTTKQKPDEDIELEAKLLRDRLVEQAEADARDLRRKLVQEAEDHAREHRRQLTATADDECDAIRRKAKQSAEDEAREIMREAREGAEAEAAALRDKTLQEARDDVAEERRRIREDGARDLARLREREAKLRQETLEREKRRADAEMQEKMAEWRRTAREEMEEEKTRMYQQLAQQGRSGGDDGDTRSDNSDGDKVRDLKAEIKAAEEDLEDTRTQLASLNAQLDAARSELRSVQRDVDDKSNALQTLQQEVQQASDKLGDIHQQIKDQEGKLEQLRDQEAAIPRQAKQQHSVQHSAAADDAEITALRRQLEQAQQCISQLETELADAQAMRETQVSSLRREMQTAQQRHEAQLADTRRKLVEARAAAVVAASAAPEKENTAAPQQQPTKPASPVVSETADAPRQEPVKAFPIGAPSTAADAPAAATSMLMQQVERVQQAKELLRGSKQELKQRQREHRAAAAQLRQEMAAASPRQREALHATLAALSSERDVINDTTRQVKEGERFIKLQEERLRLLELLDDGTSSVSGASADSSCDSVSRLSSSSIDATGVYASLHRIERELEHVYHQVRRRPSSSSSHRHRHSHHRHHHRHRHLRRRYPHTPTAWRQRRVGLDDLLTDPMPPPTPPAHPRVPEDAATLETRLAAFQRHMLKWSEERAAARLMLERHGEWLTGLRDRVTQALLPMQRQEFATARAVAAARDLARTRAHSAVHTAARMTAASVQTSPAAMPS